jgi:acetolactate synthase regulatory subunit
MQSRNLSIVLILLIAASYSFWIKPQATKITDLKAELTSVQEEIGAINGARLQIPAQADISDLEGALIEQGVPQGFDQDNLINTVKKLADEKQVNILNLSFNQSFADQSNQIKSAQITLTANGAPERVKAFLSLLENANRGFFVKNIGLTYGTVNDIDIANINITFEAFFS